MWFTGLSGAGKTTLATELVACLTRAGHTVELLDGDVVRRELWPELGFSREDRNENVARIARVATRLVRVGAVAVVAATSPFAEGRRTARESVAAHGPFVEVLVDAPVEVCEQRDPKGLYRRARQGLVGEMVGRDLPYERPGGDALVLDTTTSDPRSCVDRVLERLCALGLLEGPRST